MKTLFFGLVGLVLVGCGSDSVDATDAPTTGGSVGVTTAATVVDATPSQTVGVAGTSGLAATAVEAAGSTPELSVVSPIGLAVPVAVGGGPGTTTDRSVVAGATGILSLTTGGSATTLVGAGGSSATSVVVGVGTGGATIAGPGRSTGGSAVAATANGRAGNPNIVLIGTTPGLDIGAGGTSDVSPRIQCCWYSPVTGRVEQGTLTEAECQTLPNPWPCGLRV
jgi:hypothetical protein